MFSIEYQYGNTPISKSELRTDLKNDWQLLIPSDVSDDELYNTMKILQEESCRIYQEISMHDSRVLDLPDFELTNDLFKTQSYYEYKEIILSNYSLTININEIMIFSCQLLFDIYSLYYDGNKKLTDIVIKFGPKVLLFFISKCKKIKSDIDRCAIRTILDLRVNNDSITEDDIIKYRNEMVCPHEKMCKKRNNVNNFCSINDADYSAMIHEALKQLDKDGIIRINDSGYYEILPIIDMQGVLK